MVTDFYFDCKYLSAARPLPQQGERGQVHGAGSTAHICMKALTTCLPGARLPGLRCGDGECWRLLEWHWSSTPGIQVGTRKNGRPFASPVFSRAIEDIKILTQASFQPRTAATEGEAENVEERLGEVCRFATLHHVMSWWMVFTPFFNIMWWPHKCDFARCTNAIKPRFKQQATFTSAIKQHIQMQSIPGSNSRGRKSRAAWWKSLRPAAAGE